MMSKGRGGRICLHDGYGIEVNGSERKVGSCLITKGLSQNMTRGKEGKWFGLIYQHKGQTKDTTSNNGST